MANLSNYANKLLAEAKSCYIELIGNVDPFSIDKSAAQQCSFPPVDASNIVSYLVLQTSFITTQQFKARKSLEAYNQFTSSWVKDVRAYNVGEKCVIAGRVSSVVSI